MTDSFSETPSGKLSSFTSNTFCGFRIPVSWVLLIVVDVCLIALSSAQEQHEQPPNLKPDVQVIEIEAPKNAATGIRFDALDVFIDSGDHDLAAWQLEVQGTDERIEIVGIEGGQHSAFAEPAFYDPRAMNGNRVILAAFSTATELPSGETRVARIHVQCEGRNINQYTTSLIVTANAAGRSIPATLRLARAVGET